MKRRKPGFWFQLSHEEREQYKALAEARGCSVAELIRRGVRVLLSLEESVQPRKRRAGGA